MTEEAKQGVGLLGKKDCATNAAVGAGHTRVVARDPAVTADQQTSGTILHKRHLVVTWDSSGPVSHWTWVPLGM